MSPSHTQQQQQQQQQRTRTGFARPAALFCDEIRQSLSSCWQWDRHCQWEHHTTTDVFPEVDLLHHCPLRVRSWSHSGQYRSGHYWSRSTCTALFSAHHTHPTAAQGDSTGVCVCELCVHACVSRSPSFVRRETLGQCGTAHTSLHNLQNPTNKSFLSEHTHPHPSHPHPSPLSHHHN